MYHIGIDVAKHYHDAIGLDDAGRVVLSPFRFPNSRPGAEELITRLDALDGKARLALESTRPVGVVWDRTKRRPSTLQHRPPSASAP